MKEKMRLETRKNSAARCIQNGWIWYKGCRCETCGLPVTLSQDCPIPLRRLPWCSCERCSECRHLAGECASCEITCAGWFPPVISDYPESETDTLYEQWVGGKENFHQSAPKETFEKVPSKRDRDPDLPHPRCLMS